MKPAYERWCKDVGSRYPIPDSFVNQVLLALLFPEHLGGSPDDLFPNEAIKFPQSNIPNEWLDFAESGAIRLQTIDDKYY